MDVLTLAVVALGIGFLFLALLCLALARQVGVLSERIAPAGALAMNAILRVGQEGPTLSVNSLSGTPISLGGKKANSTLMFFLSSDCPVCASVLPAVKAAEQSERKWLDVVYLSDGDLQRNHAYAKRQDIPEERFAISEAAGRQYGVAKLPYAVLLDESGKIASLGVVNSREHIDSLFEAKERSVASIQDYMADRAGQSASTREAS